MSIDQIVSKYRFGMIARRWGALWVDGVILWLIPALPLLILGKEMYQSTLWVWIILLFAYIVVMEGKLGWTLGKLLFQIRVVNAEGKAPGLWKAAIRTTLKLFEANPMAAGGLVAAIIVLVNKKRQRVGDMLAETYVVHVKDINNIIPPDQTPEAEPSFANVVKSIKQADIEPQV